MRKFAKGGDDEAEVNMTPMLDIVFIMLIFFIVTASFVREAGLEITKPEDNNNDTPPPPPEDKCDRPIAFQIDDSNRVRFDFRTIDISSASSIIKKGNVECPKAPVVIQYAEGAFTENVMRIYDDALDIGLPVEKVIVVPKK